MTPLEKLHEQTMSALAPREADLKRMLQHGPSKKEDYNLLVSCVAFTLGELSAWKLKQLPPLPPHNS